MMLTFRFALGTALALAMISSSFVAPPAAAAVNQKAGTGCNLSYSEPWVIPARQNQPRTTLTIVATSRGQTCVNNTLTFKIQNARGQELFRQSYESEFIVVTAQVQSRVQMVGALRDWVRASKVDQFIEDLPTWEAGAAAPETREFPFTPDASITRDKYIAIKAQKPPLRCYAQGMETLNCIIFENGRIKPFGLQSFPG